MATAPTPAPTIPDNLKPLVDLQGALLDSAEAITDRINLEPDPASPKWNPLRAERDKIVEEAQDLAKDIQNVIDSEMKTALERLKIKVDEAKETIKNIKKARLMINIASAILGAAAGVATGGVVAGIPALVTLGTAVGEAIAETKEEDDKP